MKVMAFIAPRSGARLEDIFFELEHIPVIGDYVTVEPEVIQRMSGAHLVPSDWESERPQFEVIWRNWIIDENGLEILQLGLKETEDPWLDEDDE